MNDYYPYHEHDPIPVPESALAPGGVFINPNIDPLINGTAGLPSGGVGGGGAAFATETGLFVFQDSNGVVVYLERITDENTGVSTDTYYDAPSGGNVVIPVGAVTPYNAPDAVYTLAVTSEEVNNAIVVIVAGFSAVTFTNMGSAGNQSTTGEPAVIAGRAVLVGESTTFGGHPATVLPAITVDATGTLVRVYREALV